MHCLKLFQANRSEIRRVRDAKLLDVAFDVWHLIFLALEAQKSKFVIVHAKSDPTAQVTE